MLPFRLVLMVLVIILAHSNVWAENKSKGPPPAKVRVAEAKNGLVSPQAEFIGTVFFQEVSDVASEVSGIVEVVKFDEGQRTKQGQVLVKLSGDLLQKRLQATASSHEQVLSDLERARIDLERMEKLFQQESVAKQQFDEHTYRVKGLENRAASLQAEVERLELELQKKTIKAPFNGVVIKRNVDRGEWVSEGDSVATIGKDEVMEIVVNVPEWVLKHVTKGAQVNMKARGQELTGEVLAIVPEGDIATRTFPVKIQVQNALSLMEGMEARVSLPAGERKEVLIVPRDAVISMFGQTVVFAVTESKASMIPVTVVGYEGLAVGISAQGLEDGMKVVVKGNERLRDGQSVVIINNTN
jgi:RND family efflux transporter MFP subunit